METLAVDLSLQKEAMAQEIMSEPVRVICVEDNSIDREIILHALRRLLPNINVVFSESAEDFLEKHGQKNDYDLLILDALLPGMSGLEVLSQMRKSKVFQDLPIILCTSLDSPRIRSQAEEVGVTRFVAKTMDMSELAQSVVDILRTSHVEQAKGRDLNFLMIEDSRVDFEIFKRYIHEKFTSPCFVHRVGSLAETLKLNGDDWDLVILDLNLPDGEGLDLLHKIRSWSPNVPILILTGMNNEELAMRSLEEGAQDYLLKNEINADQLAKSLRFAFARDNTQRRFRSQIHSMKHTVDELKDLSHRDPLTKLLNRRGLDDVLKTYASFGSSRYHAVLFVDLDDFKAINDNHGHTQGDVVLQSVATAILSSVRPADHVARVGGDEFMAFFPDTRLEEAKAIAERVQQAVRSIQWNAPLSGAHITSSLGLAPLRGSVDSVSALLSSAQMALKCSKGSGKDSLTVTPLSKINIYSLLSDLTKYKVIQQPIRHLQTRQCVGIETFTRLHCNEQETLNPNQFLAAAREFGILSDIDLLCMEASLRDVSLPPGAALHANISIQTLQTPKLYQLLNDYKGSVNVPLCLEINVQDLTGTPHGLVRACSHLKRMGITLALDHVDTHGKGIEAMLLLEPSVMKVDKSLIKGVASSLLNQQILQRLQRVSTALGCRLVACGIDNQKDHDILRELGIEYGQGEFITPYCVSEDSKSP